MRRCESYVEVRNDKMNFKEGPFSAVAACCLKLVSASFQMAISYALSHHLSITSFPRYFLPPHPELHDVSLHYVLIIPYGQVLRLHRLAL